MLALTRKNELSLVVLVGHMPRWFTSQQPVAHPSTNYIWLGVKSTTSRSSVEHPNWYDTQPSSIAYVSQHPKPLSSCTLLNSAMNESADLNAGRAWCWSVCHWRGGWVFVAWSARSLQALYAALVPCTTAWRNTADFVLLLHY